MTNTELAHELQRYVIDLRSKGFTVIEIAEIFRQPVLPTSLYSFGSADQIRRVAQLVVSRLAKEHSEQHQQQKEREIKDDSVDKNLFGLTPEL